MSPRLFSGHILEAAGFEDLALASQAQLSKLIGVIYDLVEHEEGTGDFLAELSTAVGATCSNLCTVSDGVFDYCSETVPYEFLQNEYLPLLASDPWYLEAQKRPSGIVLRNTDLISTDDYKKHEHYWINHRQDFEHMAGVGCLSKSFDLQYFVTCLRPPSAGEHPDENLELLRLLVPHLDRMFRFRESARIDIRRIGQPALVIEDNCWIDCNAAAEHLLLRSGLHPNRGVRGRLLKDHRDNERLLAAMRESSAEPRLIRLSGRRAVLVPRSYLTQSYSRAYSYLLVFLADSTIANTAALERLSPAERQVAVLLCRGLSMNEISIERKRSVGTVRSQVKNIMRKASVRSQAQLVVTLMKDQ